MNNVHDTTPEYEEPYLPEDVFNPRPTNIPFTGLKMTHTRELRSQLESGRRDQWITNAGYEKLLVEIEKVDYSANNSRAHAESRLRELSRSLRDLTRLREAECASFNRSTSMQNRQASEREDTIAQLNRMLTTAGDKIDEKDKALENAEKTAEIQHKAIQQLDYQLATQRKLYNSAEKHNADLIDKLFQKDIQIKADQSIIDAQNKRLDEEKGIVNDLINQADARAKDLADLRKKLRRRIEENGRLNEEILSMQGKKDTGQSGWWFLRDIGPQEIAPDYVTEAQAREARETAAAVEQEIKENAEKVEPGPPRTLREDLNVKFPPVGNVINPNLPYKTFFPKPGQVQEMGPNGPRWVDPPESAKDEAMRRIALQYAVTGRDSFTENVLARAKAFLKFLKGEE